MPNPKPGNPKPGTLNHQEPQSSLDRGFAIHFNFLVVLHSRE